MINTRLGRPWPERRKVQEGISTIMERERERRKELEAVNGGYPRRSVALVNVIVRNTSYPSLPI
jgi:hypothetical protein